MKKQNPIALLPIAVFLVLYLGLGILFEYIMKIPMGFYNVPIIIAFLVAILVACLQNRSVKFDQKLEIMAQGLADKNIITMLLIPYRGSICGCSRSKQCGERGIFHAVTDTGKVRGDGAFCCGMLCVYCDGDIGWNHNTDCADSGSSIGCIGLWPATLYRLRNGWRDVRRQPFLYIRYDHCRM